MARWIEGMAYDEEEVPFEERCLMSNKFLVESLSQGTLIIKADSFYIGETFTLFYVGDEARHVFSNKDILYFRKETN